MTGPNSRTSISATTIPSDSSAPKLTRMFIELKSEHHADEQAGDQDDHQRKHADRVDLIDHETETGQQRIHAAENIGKKDTSPAQASRPL